MADDRPGGQRAHVRGRPSPHRNLQGVKNAARPPLRAQNKSLLFCSATRGHRRLFRLSYRSARYRGSILLLRSCTTDPKKMIAGASSTASSALTFLSSPQAKLFPSRGILPRSLFIIYRQPPLKDKFFRPLPDKTRQTAVRAPSPGGKGALFFFCPVSEAWHLKSRSPSRSHPPENQPKKYSKAGQNKKRAQQPYKRQVELCRLPALYAEKVLQLPKNPGAAAIDTPNTIKRISDTYPTCPVLLPAAGIFLRKCGYGLPLTPAPDCSSGKPGSSPK